MTTEPDHPDQASDPSVPMPHPMLRELDVLEGTWRYEAIATRLGERE